MKTKLTVLSLFLVLIVACQISLAADAPAIVSRGNNVTNNDDLNINVERLSSVTFNVTANQTIDNWHWTNATIISGNGTADSNASKQFTATGSFNVTVYGNNTNGTTNNITWNVTVVDTAPANVTGLANDTPTQTTVNLTWTANTEVDLWGYEVFKNDTHLAYTQNNYYNVTGLTTSTLYQFKVRANDSSGNWGDNSSSIQVTTAAAPAPVATPTYNISGYVLNASGGKLIIGATVNNTTLGSNTTDANGRYILSGAANGTWRIIATANGYIGNSIDAIVNGADIVNQNITLTPVAPAPPHPGALKIVWFSPGAVDYVFVNETESETITYNLTTNQPTTSDSWYLDYVLVSTGGQSFSKKWNDSDVGRHVIKYTGKNANGTVSFEWYVNVYNETEMPSEKKGLFEIIDEALSNHFYDIKIRMFEYKVELSPNASERARLVRERNQLMHDEIAKRQMTREALRKEFKDGNISKDIFVSAMHKVQSEMKNAVKEQKSIAKIEKKAGPANNGKNGKSNGKGHDK